MSSTLDAAQLFEQEFLGLRAKILEVAATLDRFDRAGGDSSDDPRVGQIRQALAVLAEDDPDRAERVQLIFSLDYQHDWKSRFDLS